jgi:hypothetical protein
VFLIEQPSSLEKSNQVLWRKATPTVATLQQKLHLVSNVFFYSNAYITCAQHPFLEWDKIAKL